MSDLKHEVEEEIKSRPLLYIIMTIISVVLMFFMKSSVATVGIVEQSKKELTKYVDARHDSVAKRLDRIEKKLDTIILRQIK
jgi:hypothetical protein